MSTQFKSVCALCLLALLGIVIYYPHSPMGRQARNMKLTEAHIPVLQRAFADDERFRNLRLHPSTSGGGSLMVGGQVENGDDFQSLLAIVRSSGPPMPVVLQLRIQATNEQTYYWLLDGREGDGSVAAWSEIEWK